MKKTLKLVDFFRLKQELEDILKLKLSMVTRFNLVELKKKVDGILSSAELIREELIKKYGEEEKETGAYTIQYSIKDKDGNQVINPNFFDFNKDWTEIVNEEREIEYTPIKFSLLQSIESEVTAEVIFEFIDETK